MLGRVPLKPARHEAGDYAALLVERESSRGTAMCHADRRGDIVVSPVQHHRIQRMASAREGCSDCLAVALHCCVSINFKSIGQLSLWALLHDNQIGRPIDLTLLSN